MKKLYILTFAILLTASAFSQPGTITGTVNYKNIYNTPILDSCIVKLMQGASVIASTYVTSTGGFTITGINPGTYTLKAVCTKMAGGINAADALYILASFVGLVPPLTGLNLLAADVNGSGGSPNSADAFAISRFFVGAIPNFMPPNVPAPGAPSWLSETFTVTVTSFQVVTQNIKVLCTGDVNGSYVP